MRSDRAFWLATMNAHKFREAQRILAEFEVKVWRLPVPKIEVQSSNLEKVSSFAANNISKTHKGIVVVEDSGLFVRSLGGFPGPYSAYVHKTLGSNGILRLMENNRHREAYFQASLAASSSGRTRQVFTGRVRGKISWSEKGRYGFGFDPIFIPERASTTFGEMKEKEKNQYSHRSKGFRKLARWFLSS